MKVEELVALTESLPQIVWTARPDGALDYTNRRWVEYSGSNEPTEWTQFVHPDDLKNVLPIWTEKVRSGNDYESEFRLLRKSDNLYRWHLVRATAVRNDRGEVTKWFGTNTDIHDQKVLLQKFEKERDLRERFVATLTHDLRSPMSAAKLSAQLILRKVTDAALVQKNAHRIISSLNRADMMISDLLDAILIRSGGTLALHLEDINLVQVISSVIAELSFDHENRFKFHHPESIVAEVDVRNFRRLIENLSANAIKYGDTQKEIEISLKDIGEFFELRVKNFGNPLNPEEKQILFDAAEINKSSRLAGTHGWGLGLTVVKGIVDAHGGKIKVESSPEDGTSFEIQMRKTTG